MNQDCGQCILGDADTVIVHKVVVMLSHPVSRIFVLYSRSPREYFGRKIKNDKQLSVVVLGVCSSPWYFSIVSFLYFIWRADRETSMSHICET